MSVDRQAFHPPREALDDRYSLLTLLLFMLRIFTANDHHNAVTPDNLTVLTTRFYRGTYFHELALQTYRDKMYKEAQVNAPAAE
jgi:hypothetical protein